jgi:hypothetical protein
MPDSPLPPQPVIDTGSVLLTWQAPSIPVHERTKRWYLTGGVVVVLCAVYGILSGSWLFAVVALLCGGLYFLLKDHLPADKSITVTDQGVMFEQHFVRWDDLSGFWVLETPTYNQLHILRKNPRAGNITILTGSLNLLAVKTAFAEHIPEQTDKRENFFDMIIRLCKL